MSPDTTYSSGRLVANVIIQKGPFWIDSATVTSGHSYAPPAAVQETVLSNGEVLAIASERLILVNVCPSMFGTVTRGGERFSLSELREANVLSNTCVSHAALQHGDRLELKVDDVRITVEAEFGVELAKGGMIPQIGRNSSVIGALSLALHCLILGIAFVYPAQSVAFDLDPDFGLRSRYLATSTMAQKQLAPPLKVVPRDQNMVKAVEGVDGPVSADSSPVKNASAVRKVRQRFKGKGSRPDAAAVSVGVLSLLQETTFQNIDAITTMSAKPIAGVDGDQHGAGPFRVRAAPSRYEGSLGGGSHLVSYNRPEERVGAGTGDPKVQLERHSTRFPPTALKMSTPHVIGALSKQIIRRQFQANRGRFRYCYEKGLQQNRSLSGRVVLSFSIDASGRVIRAVRGGSTLNSPAVEACLISSVQRLRFPTFVEGTVAVNYPLTFRPK